MDPSPDNTTKANGENKSLVFLLSQMGQGAGKKHVASSHDEENLPRIFGKFVLSEELGAGGMGLVFKARQTDIDRDVALKIVRPDIWAALTPNNKAVLKDRLRVEAQVGSSVVHPNTVTIYESGEIDAIPYLSMQLVEGTTVLEKLREDGISSTETATMFAGIARGLHELHETGGVHRDITPRNIFLTSEPTAVLGDFGLAKSLTDESDLTQEATFLGTIAYSSPEQIHDARNVDRRADIYGMGASMYRCLANRAPFAGGTDTEKISKVLSDDPVAITVLNESVSRDFEAVCLKCMEKKPENRYSTAAELANDLENIIANRPTSARPIGRVGRVVKWFRREPAIGSLAIAVASLLIAIGIVSAIGWRNSIESNVELSSANRKTTSTLARSNFHLAWARWDQQRPQEARILLDSIPKSERFVEWHFSRRLFDGSQRTLYGHTMPIYSLDVSPDGKTIATGSSSGKIILWDLGSGTELATLAQHDGLINCVKFSPCGEWLASCGEDHSIRIWDIKTASQLFEIQGHDAVVRGVAFSSDGKFLVSASNDNTLKVWKLNAGSPPSLVFTLLGHTDEVACVEFSPDGSIIATGSHDGTIKLWPADNLAEEPKTLSGHGSHVRDLAFSPDGSKLASAGYIDATVRIWDCESGQQLSILSHVDRVVTCAFSPDGQRIASCGYDSKIRIWEVATSKLVDVLVGHAGRVWEVEFTKLPNELVSIGVDNTVKIWDLSSPYSVQSVFGEEQQIHKPDQNPDSDLKFWQFPEIVAQLQQHQKSKTKKLSDFTVLNENRIAKGEVDGTVSVFQLPEYKKLSSWQAHDKTVRSLAFCPQSNRLLTGEIENHDNQPHLIRLWDLDTHELLAEYQGHNREIRDLAFSPNGKHFSSGSGDSTIKIWNLETGENVTTLRGHKDAIFSIAYHPSGTRLLSGCLDGTIKIWDLQNNVELLTLDSSDQRVLALAFDDSGDGFYSRLGSNQHIDREISAWNSSPYKQVRLSGHQDLATTVALSPDEKWIASGSHDGTAIVWDRKTLQPIEILTGAGDQVRLVSFSDDGNYLEAIDKVGNRAVWEVGSWQPTSNAPAWNSPTDQRYSKDGRWKLATTLNDVLLIDLHAESDQYKPEAQASESGVH